MKNSLRKLLSLFLAVLMCLSLAPVSAFSEGPEDPAEAEELTVAGETPAEEPAEPAEEPEEPAEEPEEPAEEPEIPAEEPEAPAEEPDNPEEDPAEPAEEPELPADEEAPEDPASEPEEAETDESEGEDEVEAESVYDDVYEADCGDNVKWTWTKATYTIVISGSGPMYDYSLSNNKTTAPWLDYLTYNVVIGPGVTSVGDYAFYKKAPTSLIIGGDVTRIGTGAFYSGQFSGVSIPNSVTAIGNEAFRYCVSLYSVNVPGSVTSMGSGVFANCSELVMAGFDEGVTAIPADTFASCSSLRSVTIPASVTSVGTNAFNGASNLRDVNYDGRATAWQALQSSIASGNAKLTGATVHYSMEGTCGGSLSWVIDDDWNLVISGTGSMMDYSAAGAGTAPWYGKRNRISTAVVSSGVTTIGGGAFRESNFRNIEIPNTVTYIGRGAFYLCDNVNITFGGTLAEWNNIYVAEDNEALDSAVIHCDIDRGTCGSGLTWVLKEDYSLIISGTGAMTDYSQSSPAPWSAYAGDITSVSLPAGLTRVGALAFDGLGGISSVSIPNSITAVGNDAFRNCSNLRDVYYSGSNSEWAAIQMGSGNGCLTGAERHLNIAYGTCGTNLRWTLSADYDLVITGTGAMTDYTQTNRAPWYSYRAKIRSITLPAGLTRVGNYAFYGCYGLASAAMPEGVTAIGSNAFQGCSMLAEVTIPRSTRTIGDYAFDISNPVSQVYYSGTSADWNAISVGRQNQMLTGAGNIHYYAGYGSCGAGVEWSLSDQGALVISGSGNMNSFPNGAPWSGLQVVSLVIEPGVRNIGDGAFAGITAIRQLEIPNTVTSIGSDAFRGCTGLESVTIPESVTSIAATAFSGCTGLRKVLFNGSRAQWSNITASAGGKLQGFDKASVSCFEDYVSLTLSHDYLLLNPGETAKISATVEPASIDFRLRWTSEDSSVANVSAAGLVRAGTVSGTTYVIASIDDGKVEARCRIDVTVPTDSVNPRNVTGVQLLTTSAASNIYKTTGYPTVSFLPILEQNLESAALSLESAEAGDTGVAVVSARFVSAALNQYFSLRVRDDRTLEIIPTPAAVENAKTLKAYYNSAIEIYFEGNDLPVTTSNFKLTVQKTLPKIKVANVTLNSYSTRIGELYSLKFSGGTVCGIEPDTEAAERVRKTAVPEFMVLDTDMGTVSLSTSWTGKYPEIGNVFMKVNVEGWSVPVSVKLVFLIKKTAPKLTFGKTVTFIQGSPDYATVSVKMTPATVSTPTVSSIEKLVGNSYKTIVTGEEACAASTGEIQVIGASTAGGYSLRVAAPNVSSDGKAHTYRIVLTCEGKNFYYTVKTLATSVKPAVNFKSSGTVNTKVSGSSIKITLTPKNFRAGIGETYTLEKVSRYKGTSTKAESGDYQRWFNVSVSGDGNVFTLTAREPVEIVAGYTYKAVIRVTVGGTSGTVTVPLRISFPAKAPSVSVNAARTGTLDVTRRGNAITLKTSVNNLYGTMMYDLEVYKKSGTKYNLVSGTDGMPFVYTENNGVFTVGLKDSVTAAASGYYVVVKAKLTSESEWHVSKYIQVPVTKGRVTVKSSATTVKLFKQDSHSRAPIVLTIADASVSKITNVVPAVNTFSKKFQVVKLSEGVYAIEYKDNLLPSSFASGTLKLSIYVDGCDTTAAVVNVKVTFK